MIPMPVIYSIEDAATIEYLAEDASAQASIAKRILENIEIEIPNIEIQQEYQTAISIPKKDEIKSTINAGDGTVKKQIEEQHARETLESIITASRANGGNVIVASGLDSYPYAGQCPGVNWRYTGLVETAYGGALCECTGYAGWKAYEYWGYSIPWAADAKGWGYMAATYGLNYNSTPAAHTIGVQYAGIWGHVVWIEHVNDDGTVNVSEYNNTYSSGGKPASFGYQTNVPASSYYYIHFD